MDSTLAGILILLALIGYQIAHRLWVRHSFQRWWEIGNDACRQHDWDTAETAFRHCARLLAPVAQVHRAFGAVLVRQDKLEEAEKHFRLAAGLEPKDAGGHADLGMFLALCTKDHIEEAIDSFEQAISCAPEIRQYLLDHPQLTALRENPRFRKLLGIQS